MSERGAAECPTGFVARCRCGIIVAAMDVTRLGRQEVGKELGAWLYRGDTVEPRFGAWQEEIRLGDCRCKNK